MSQGRKIYYVFEEIKEIFKNHLDKDGTFKPWGTMGTHHMLITPTPKGDKYKVKGSAEGEVILGPNDTVGYHLGRVWRVPRPDEYKDPIRGLLAEKKISQSVLKYSDEKVRCYSGDDFFVLGERTIGNRDENGNPAHVISGGEVVLVTTRKYIRITGTYRTVVDRIIIRSWADRAKALEWLRENL